MSAWGLCLLTHGVASGSVWRMHLAAHFVGVRGVIDVGLALVELRGHVKLRRSAVGSAGALSFREFAVELVRTGSSSTWLYELFIDLMLIWYMP